MILGDTYMIPILAFFEKNAYKHLFILCKMSHALKHLKISFLGAVYTHTQSQNKKLRFPF